VKVLAELHGGTVAVESAVGEGSNFTVWLPLRESESELLTGAKAPAAARVIPMGTAGTALVVEDDFKAADLIRVQLEAEGFKVLHAASAEAALVLAIQQPLSLITLDIQLPNMDGWELLGRLKQVPELRGIPVVILSIVADASRGLALGAAAVMQKPISRLELYEALVGLSLFPRPKDHKLTVLVVDDDPDVRDSLRRALGHAGYEVTTAVHGADALDSVARSPVDLIVLDVLMPMVDGFDACRKLRERGDPTPILVLTARDAIDDRVTGLEVGADDYLVKPFALRELMARVRALLRRSQSRRDVLGYADLTLDVTARTVTRDGQAIALTRIEFGLLELLLRNAEQVLSYEVILERVWGYEEAPASNALQVFVGFLRRKLEDGGRPRLLHNVRGIGYVLRAVP